MVILDRHLKWQSLDPTLDISSTFMKKHSASFFSFASFSFKRDPTFHKNASFLLYLPSYLPGYPYGCQMFPNLF